MTPHMLEFVRDMHWYNGADEGPVLEIGSYIEANQEHLDLRRAFRRGAPYLGIDVNEGPGVDRVASLLDAGQMSAVLDSFAPKVILCLYVIEHVWDVRAAAGALAAAWKRYPESWLWVATHQNQPFHGTEKYGDFWRLTAPGLCRLMEEAGVPDGRGFVLSDPSTGRSNPSDVVVVRQPASLPWDEGAERLACAAAQACGPARWERSI